MSWPNALLILLTLVSSMQEMLQNYRLQLKGDALYAERSYPQAEGVFRQLLTTLPENSQITSARFNLGCALYMQGKYPEAESLFSSAAKSGNAQQDLQLQALFNEGNSLAMRALASSAKDLKIKLFRQSLARFRSALLIDSDKIDAKINYEVIRRYLQELEKPPRGGASSLKNSPAPQPASGIGSKVAERLLEHSRQEESSLMQRLSQPGAKSAKKNNLDW